MKKYLIFSILFLLAAFPVMAKNANSSSITKGQGQKQSQNVTLTITPTGQLAQAQNPDGVENSITKVSEEVKKLLEERGEEKVGIGQQVREIAQNQEKKQEEIKSAYYQLKNRGQLIRLFVGSDKKMTQALEQLTEENKLRIEELEQLKTQTENQADLDKLENTIKLMLEQNTSLQEKIAKEKQVTGLIGWFTRLFNRNKE